METKSLDKGYTKNCEHLWKSVLKMAIKDSLKLQRCSNDDRERATNWILRCGNDFKTVCDLAGYCPIRVKNNFIQIYNKRNKRDKS